MGQAGSETSLPDSGLVFGPGCVVNITTRPTAGADGQGNQQVKDVVAAPRARFERKAASRDAAPDWPRHPARHRLAQASRRQLVRR